MENLLKTPKVKTKEEVFEFLEKWLTEQLDMSYREARSNTSFETPAWSEYQAFRLGEQKKLIQFLELLPLTKGKK